MRVALTGSSGFIGAAIARCLHQQGHRVTALVRPTSTRNHIDSAVDRYVVGDQADPRIWPDLLDQADAVVHNSVDWAPLQNSDLQTHLRSNLEGSIRLLRLAHDTGISRFVFLSSVAVHHDISPRWGGVIDEDHPLRPSGLYGAYKAAVEAHLWSAHASWNMHCAAIRPSAVYGVEPVRLARSHGYDQVRQLLEGKPVTAEDFPGGGKWVHVDDVALATVHALTRDAAAGRPFNMADCYAKRTRFAEHAAAALGLDPSMVRPDTGPPAKNQFDKTAVREILGVPLDRGDDGLKRHVEALIEAIRSSDAAR